MLPIKFRRRNLTFNVSNKLVWHKNYYYNCKFTYATHKLRYAKFALTFQIYH